MGYGNICNKAMLMISICISELPTVLTVMEIKVYYYIKNQKQHHQHQTFQQEYDAF